MVFGFAMPFVENHPFSSSIVASGVVLISLSFVTRDGLLLVFSALLYLGIVQLLSKFL